MGGGEKHIRFFQRRVPLLHPGRGLPRPEDIQLAEHGLAAEGQAIGAAARVQLFELVEERICPALRQQLSAAVRHPGQHPGDGLAVPQKINAADRLFTM